MAWHVFPHLMRESNNDPIWTLKLKYILTGTSLLYKTINFLKLIKFVSGALKWEWHWEHHSKHTLICISSLHLVAHNIYLTLGSMNLFSFEALYIETKIVSFLSSFLHTHTYSTYYVDMFILHLNCITFSFRDTLFCSFGLSQSTNKDIVKRSEDHLLLSVSIMY